MGKKIISSSKNAETSIIPLPSALPFDLDNTIKLLKEHIYLSQPFGQYQVKNSVSVLITSTKNIS